MIQTLIGQKIDQIQKFLENGRRIPVTEISVADNVVVQLKTADKDAYTAIQLGWGNKKKPIRSALGHAKKAKLENVPAVIREIRIDDTTNAPEVGEKITLETVFKPGDIIDVSGVSKGKGFAGGVKRYHFRGGPKTHGQSDRHRAPGSIGQGTTPGRVYKGKKMAGHMGAEEVTVKNLVVVDVDAASKKLYVMGLIPGPKKTNVVITVTGETKKFVPLLKLTTEEPVTEEVVSSPVEEAIAETPVEEVKTESVESVVEEKKEEKVTEEVTETAEEKEKENGK